MSTIEVSSAMALTQALSKATAGEVIRVDPGLYANVNITGVNATGGVTIVSADNSHEAVFQHLSVANSTGLTLQNLDFAVQANSRAAAQFYFTNDSNITLDHLTVNGPSQNTYVTSGSGINIGGSNGVTVSNSNFQYLSNAIIDLNNTNVNISNNSFSHIFGDGIDNGGTSNVTITANNFTTMRTDATDPAHPDCIQFWTSHTTHAANNITITDNTYSRGGGAPVQGIFLQDEVGGMPFTNVTVTGNTFLGSEYNGICLQEVANGVVANNKVIGYNDMPSWIMARSSGDIIITGNTGSNTVLNVGTAEFSAANNIQVSAMTISGDNLVAGVTGAYNFALGRDPTAAEFTASEAAVNSGETLAMLKSSLLSSSEGVAHTTLAVDNAYGDLLGRAPNSAELSAAVVNVTGGETLIDLRQSLLNTSAGQTHVAQEVSSIYQSLTDHGPTGTDISHWSADFVASGGANATAGLSSVLAASSIQATGTSEITSLFHTYYDRDPTQAETHSWQSKFANGTAIDTLQDTLERQSTISGVQRLAMSRPGTVTMGAATNLLVVARFDPLTSTINVGSHYNGLNLLDPSHAHEVTALDGTTDVMISIDAQHSILLENIHLSTLHAGDFVFH